MKWTTEIIANVSFLVSFFKAIPVDVIYKPWFICVLVKEICIFES